MISNQPLDNRVLPVVDFLRKPHKDRGAYVDGLKDIELVKEIIHQRAQFMLRDNFAEIKDVESKLQS